MSVCGGSIKESANNTWIPKFESTLIDPLHGVSEQDVEWIFVVNECKEQINLTTQEINYLFRCISKIKRIKFNLIKYTRFLIMFI